MLTDPLPIKVPTLSSHSSVTVASTDNVATTDVSPGRTVRVGTATLVSGSDAVPLTVTIAHSVSNENKPAKTDRTLVRCDFTIVDPTGKDLQAYAYAVIGTPRGGGVMTDAMHGLLGVAGKRRLVEYLLGVLAVNTASAALDETKLDRVLAGEP